MLKKVLWIPTFTMVSRIKSYSNRFSWSWSTGGKSMNRTPFLASWKYYEKCKLVIKEVWFITTIASHDSQKLNNSKWKDINMLVANAHCPSPLKMGYHSPATKQTTKAKSLTHTKSCALSIIFCFQCNAIQ